MTLNAKLRIGVEVGDRLERRAVGSMTASAIQGQVLVPLIDHLLADRMSRVSLPVMTIPTQIHHIVLLEEEDLVGRMRGVTGGTFPLINRGVLDHGVFHLIERVGVAGSAQRFRFIPQERRLLGGMRTVAVQAADPVDGGPMDAVPGKNLIHQIAVATPAKFEAGSFDVQGIRGG